MDVSGEDGLGTGWLLSGFDSEEIGIQTPESYGGKALGSCTFMCWTNDIFLRDKHFFGVRCKRIGGHKSDARCIDLSSIVWWIYDPGEFSSECLELYHRAYPLSLDLPHRIHLH